MSIIEIVTRFRAFLNRHTVEREMDDEMRFHLEMEAEKHMRAGMSPTAARRAAVLAFGGVDRHQETMRDHRGGRWLEDLGRDLRFSARTLARNPGFALAAMLTLALAIGINSMVFTMVNGILLRPFPVPQPDELVAVWGVDERDHGAIQVSYEDYVDWRDRSGLFSSLAAQMNAPLSFTDGAAEILWSELVTGNYFTVLGLKPELGRFFVAGEEARAGASPYVVLSHDLWQRRFQGDPQVIGRKITIQQRPLEVIGVAPKSFHGIRRLGFWPDLWVPLGAPGTENLLRGRGPGSLTLFGRLRPGLDRARAEAPAKAFAQSLSEAYPETNRAVGAMLTSARGPFESPRFVPPRIMVLASTLGLVGTALILLIACANVANLLLARASARRREIAVRLSIGGSRGRIIRQLFTESALLALIGGLGGLALALLSARLQGGMVPQLQFRVGLDLTVDHRVVLFTMLLAFAAVFFFGLAPALQATRLNLVGALRNDTATGRRHSRLPELRSVLVGAQIAMSIVLLVAGTLFMRSLSATRAGDFGFETANRLMISANPTATGYDAARAAAFYREVSRRVQQEPGVISASWAFPFPFDTNDRGVEVHIGGTIESGERQTLPLPMSTVEPRYFETIGMPMLAGRDFTLRDTLGAPRVMIVNRTAAERLWPGRNAIGERVRLDGPSGQPVEVVGVVERAVYFSPTEAQRPFAYFPAQQHSTYGLTLVVHTRRAPAPMIERMREIIRSVDPQVATFGAITMERAVRNALNNQATAASISTTLAVLALILATVGLYGVVAYGVERRTREIGIRIALGARPASVVRLVLAQITGTTLIGVAIGMVGAFVVGRAVSSLLHGVSPTDPLTFIGIPLFLTAIALLASYVPARRATRVHPMIALRRE